uniref:Mitochondrial ribosomal protein L43 n=1 Tax=Fundulus heteroclitus TaxID=8078 RepID=A0A3Q2PB06_FUNHE
MTSRGTPSRFLRSVLQNGVGRYVCQLKRISIIFSKKSQSSLGYVTLTVCDYGVASVTNVFFIFLVFGFQSLQITFLVFPFQFSRLAVNGNTKEELITNKTSQQVLEVLTKLTNQSGLDIIRIRKPLHTDSPSIQGQWHPFTNRPPSLGLIRPQNQHAE